MNRRLLTVLASVLVLALVAGISLARREGLWTLELTNRGFMHIMTQGPEGPVVSYYIPYEATNKTGQDLTINPNGMIVTETGKTLMATPNPKAAFEICKGVNREMADIDAFAKEPLADGKSRQGLFIWTGLDDAADKLDIYLYGLSNDYKYADEAARTGLLRKVYHLKVLRPGSENNRHQAPVTIQEEGWTWVPTDIKTGVKSEAVPEVKPEAAPEVKPEAEPEVKPEAEPEAEPEAK